MRRAALVVLGSILLAACGQGGDPASAPAGNAPAPAPATAEVGLRIFAGAGRDRLCLRDEAGGVAGFVAYAPAGDASCTVRGTFDKAKGAIVPNGDENCRIPVTVDAQGALLGAFGPACAYYCGPGADAANRRFAAAPPATPPIVDVAGDPLC